MALNKGYALQGATTGTGPLMIINLFLLYYSSRKCLRQAK